MRYREKFSRILSRTYLRLQFFFSGSSAWSHSRFVPVNKLRRKGVRIFAVGFGIDAPLYMLSTITEREYDLIHVWSLYTLIDIVEYLVKMILHAIGKLEKKLN